MKRIFFQSKAAPEYRFLSNFHIQPFVVNGHSYQTNEHYYQAMKAVLPHDHDRIRDAITPGAARRFGQEIRCREDWLEKHPSKVCGLDLTVRDHAMITGLLYKFSYNPDLEQKLLDTGDSELCEYAPWGDTYWGCTENPDGTLNGRNRLGELLMAVREEFRLLMGAM